MDIFKSPIEWLKELITELVKDYSNMAFDWISLFMLKPTDLTKYGYIKEVYGITFKVAVLISVVFLMFNLIKILVQTIGGYQSRSSGEVVSKTVLGLFFAGTSPFILELLFDMNNVFTKIWLDKGIDTKTLAKFATFPPTTTISIMVMASIVTIMFVILSFQYIRRLAEIMVLHILAPIMAITAANEDMNIWPIWWREAVCTVFQQSLQTMILWLIFNHLGNAKSLNDYTMAAGLMIIVLIGPAVLRRYLYSTGTGRMMVGAAGGASKMAIYKLAARKLATK